MILVVLTPSLYVTVLYWLLFKSTNKSFSSIDSSLKSELKEFDTIILSVLEEWKTIINVGCLFILTLLIHFNSKKQVEPLKVISAFESEKLSEKVNSNIFVTVAHIGVVFAYSVILVIEANF